MLKTNLTLFNFYNILFTSSYLHVSVVQPLSKDYIQLTMM